MRRTFDYSTLFQDVPQGFNRLRKAEVGDLYALVRLFEGYTESRYQAGHIIKPSYTEY